MPPRPRAHGRHEHAAEHYLDRVIHQQRALSSPKRGWSGKTIFMTGIPKVSDLCEAQKSAQMTSPGGKGLLSILVVAVSINTAPKKTSWRLNTTTVSYTHLTLPTIYSV